MILLLYCQSTKLCMPRRRCRYMPFENGSILIIICHLHAQNLYLANCKVHSTICRRGGYPNPNDCSKCICPMGFGGEFCDELQPAQNADCGGKLYATDTWQQLEGAIGGNKTIYPSICTWHIIVSDLTILKHEVQ